MVSDNLQHALRSLSQAPPFGVMTAPDEYQLRIHESLQNLSDIEDIVDDILCVGESTVQDHDRNSIALLERCREKNIKLNPKTLQLRRQEVGTVHWPLAHSRWFEA